MSYQDFNRMISKPIGECPPPTTRHIAVVGASGTGKTTWSCQAKDCLVILTEAQAEGRVSDTAGAARVVVIARAGGDGSDFDKLTECIEWLTRDLLAEGRDGGWVPKTIVVDSFTEMFRMVGDYVSAGGTKAWTFEIWKKYGDLCMRLVRRFRDMGPTLVGVFLDETQDGGESQKSVRRMSVGMKSMSNRVAGLFDMVFWTEVKERSNEETVYAIRTVGGNYDGMKLEQGKGHPAIPKWIDPAKMLPTDIHESIDQWRISKKKNGEDSKPKKKAKAQKKEQ